MPICMHADWFVLEVTLVHPSRYIPDLEYASQKLLGMSFVSVIILYSII